MAKGKSQTATWFCTSCKAANYTSYYNKKRNADIVSELSKFCKPERKHLPHKRKDTKKAAK